MTKSAMSIGHVCPSGVGRPGQVPECVRTVPATYTADEAKRVGVRGGGTDRGNWPYGANLCQVSRNRLVDWALAEGLRLTAEPSTRCLHWVTGDRSQCRTARGHRDRCFDVRREAALDHPTWWTRDGKPALILAQPYHQPTLGWVEQTRAEWGVDIEVTVDGPWYGYGALGVFITPGGAA